MLNDLSNQIETIGESTQNLNDEIDKHDCININGRVVQELSYNESLGIARYEIVTVYGERALLETATTRFTSKGSFSLDVKSRGKTPVKVSGGFTQHWPEYTESIYCDEDKVRELEKERDLLLKSKKRIGKEIRSIEKTISDFFSNL